MGARERRRRRRQAVAKFARPPRTITIFCGWTPLPMPARRLATVSGTIGEFGMTDLAFHMAAGVARQAERLRLVRRSPVFGPSPWGELYKVWWLLERMKELRSGGMKVMPYEEPRSPARGERLNVWCDDASRLT